jgi:hypothetical protein
MLTVSSQDNRAEKDTVNMKQNDVRKRRKLSGEKKYAILEEFKRNSGSQSEILRREGLYSADIQRYEEVAREAAIKALNQSRPGPRRQQDVSIQEYESLKRDLCRRDMALSELAIEFTILKKKVNGE